MFRLLSKGFVNSWFYYSQRLVYLLDVFCYINVLLAMFYTIMQSYAHLKLLVLLLLVTD